MISETQASSTNTNKTLIRFRGPSAQQTHSGPHVAEQQNRRRATLTPTGQCHVCRSASRLLRVIMILPRGKGNRSKCSTFMVSILRFVWLMFQLCIHVSGSQPLGYRIPRRDSRRRSCAHPVSRMGNSPLGDTGCSLLVSRCCAIASSTETSTSEQ